MGRLIDADNLIKLTQKDMEFAFNNGFLDMAFEREHLIKVIRNQPTAYDLDKTVEELEELRDRYDDGIKNFAIRGIIENAIEIVKQGGVSDDVCEWEVKSNYYVTKCSHDTDVMYGLKQDFKFCPYCGKKIKEMESK